MSPSNASRAAMRSATLRYSAFCATKRSQCCASTSSKASIPSVASISTRASRTFWSGVTSLRAARSFHALWAKSLAASSASCSAARSASMHGNSGMSEGASGKLTSNTASRRPQFLIRARKFASSGSNCSRTCVSCAHLASRYEMLESDTGNGPCSRACSSGSRASGTCNPTMVHKLCRFETSLAVTSRRWASRASRASQRWRRFESAVGCSSPCAGVVTIGVSAGLPCNRRCRSSVRVAKSVNCLERSSRRASSEAAVVSMCRAVCKRFAPGEAGSGDSPRTSPSSLICVCSLSIFPSRSRFHCRWSRSLCWQSACTSARKAASSSSR
mmetsp:Transcript_67248/g.187652  ORF Transcript_67248/g.187652 Transcript_67248/m.187652 type:complete len:329 (-) Transcript_67248:96-1082(-)